VKKTKPNRTEVTAAKAQSTNHGETTVTAPLLDSTPDFTQLEGR
jgi:hypothetical protein